MILVSGCLVGEKCKYNGDDNFSQKLDNLLEGREYVTVCPEELGGLGTPRPKSEIRGDKVVSEFGVDVSDNFNKGALATLEIAKKNNVKIAIMKESSPSCGSQKVYDGTFSGVKIPGLGIAARMLSDSGIKVYSEVTIDEFQ